MTKPRMTPLSSTSRFLVAGAAVLFALLVGATAFTNGIGLDVRQRLTSDTAPSNSRAQAAAEINRLMGRGGFAGQLLSYAAAGEARDLQVLVHQLDQATIEAERFSSFGSEDFTRHFLEVARGRIAQGRLVVVSLGTNTRDAAVTAIDFAADLAGFEAAYTDYRLAEQHTQTQSALNVLNIQRWITSLALAAAVFVMGAAAIMLYLNVRKPLRDLAENLEDLLVDEEDRTLVESERTDEIGMVARVAEDLRRSQLQAGRLLTVGPDGALRLRLEGDNALAVDEALEVLTTATDKVRATALALSSTGEKLAEESQDIFARVEGALTETVEETSGRLVSLSDAGDEVLRLAGDMESTRRSLASTEAEWRNDAAELTEYMHGELEALRSSTARISEMAYSAGARVDGIGDRISEVTGAWENEQKALNESSIQARENLAARLVALDVQIGNLDDTLAGLEDLTLRAAPPIESAAGTLKIAVNSLNVASESAGASAELLSKEVEASRNARLSIISESEADRAHWQQERGTFRQQAEDVIGRMTDTANRVDGLARELTESSEEVPGKLDRLTGDLAGLSAQIHNIEQTGGALAAQLGGRLTNVCDALGEARNALTNEAETIRDVTGDLKDLHITFEDESRTVREKVGSVTATLASLDKHLEAINRRVAVPVDLSPVLAALKDEMGRAVTHLTQTVENQGINAQSSMIDALAGLSGHMTEVGAGQEQLIATGLSELSVRLDARISAQSDAAGRLVGLLSDIQQQLGDVATSQKISFEDLHAEGADRPAAGDVAALIEPRLDTLHHMASSLGDELRAISQQIADQGDHAAPDVLDRIDRIEVLQGGLGEAQQAVAVALHDGLVGIARRLRASDTSAVTEQLDHVVSALIRQQDRLAEAMLDMSTDLGARIDELAGEIARGSRITRTPRGSVVERSNENGPLIGDARRLARTEAPKENDLSAIYAALRGLTAELKGLSDETPNPEQGSGEVEKDRQAV